jgi:tetratricopeptide (TPR) repeat protein
MCVQRWVALVLAISIGLAVAGHSSEAATLDPRELTARKEFAAGRYAQSVELFAELFAETGEAVFLRNIARCYQKMQRPDEAISNFQEYLSKANVSPAERAEIAAYVRQMEELKRERAQSDGNRAAAAGESEKPANRIMADRSFGPSPVAAPSAPASVSPVATATSTSETMQSSEGAGQWRTAGITTAIGGVALIGTGIGFGLAARAAADDVRRQWNLARHRAGQRYETLQWVSYGIGAAALATGGLMYLYGSGRTERSTGVSIMAASVWPPQLGMEARF